ncbi:MAG: SoxR reducing system RseC family protein [Desulfatitalea sp.]|nr:SoxR reducing system RseC family protein [Desulfatitalea sp.]NNK00719.1 SoxR reducing system RseC family protein [Desulfatitalea sp.]
MAVEQGIVTKLGIRGAHTAWVKTTRSNACESCASRKSCHAGPGDEQEVEAINVANADVGDHIQLSINTSSVFSALFLIYIFPILAMLGGGIAGNWLARTQTLNPSIAAAAAALLCFAAAMFVVRAVGQHLGGKASYQPKIIRILRSGGLGKAAKMQKADGGA